MWCVAVYCTRLPYLLLSTGMWVKLSQPSLCSYGSSFSVGASWGSHFDYWGIQSGKPCIILLFSSKYEHVFRVTPMIQFALFTDLLMRFQNFDRSCVDGDSDVFVFSWPSKGALTDDILCSVSFTLFTSIYLFFFFFCWPTGPDSTLHWMEFWHPCVSAYLKSSVLTYWSMFWAHFLALFWPKMLRGSPHHPPPFSVELQ